MVDDRLELPPTTTARRMVGYAVVMAALMLGVGAGKTGIILAGVLLAGYVALFVKLGRARLVVDSSGVEHRGIFGTRRIRWDEVRRYTYLSHAPSGSAGTGLGVVGALAVAAAKKLTAGPGHRVFSAGSLVLHGDGGARLSISPHFKHVDWALDRAFAELHQRLATSDAFGTLAFDGKTLRHARKGELSLAEIERVAISGGLLQVFKVEKRIAWASSAVRSIDNVVVLLERLASCGVRLDLPEGFFLPEPTLEVIARAAALPKATVHVGA